MPIDKFLKRTYNKKRAVKAFCPRLSEYGHIVKNEIAILANTYDTVSVNKYIIMQNHIHMIAAIELDNGGRMDDGGRTQFVPTVSHIIKQFNGSITKQIGFSLWQLTR